VDGGIETQPRCIAANRGRPQRDRDEAGLTLGLEHLLAQRLVFRVVGQWIERQILRDVHVLLDAIYRRRRSVDEAAHAGILAGLYQRAEAVIVDRTTKVGIEIE